MWEIVIKAVFPCCISSPQPPPPPPPPKKSKFLGFPTDVDDDVSRLRCARRRRYIWCHETHFSCLCFLSCQYPDQYGRHLSDASEVSPRYFEVKLSLQCQLRLTPTSAFCLTVGRADRYLDATSSIPRQYWSGFAGFFFLETLRRDSIVLFFFFLKLWWS